MQRIGAVEKSFHATTAFCMLHRISVQPNYPLELISWWVIWVNWGYKCRHFVHIRVSQSAGSQQLAHLPLFTLLVHVYMHSLSLHSQVLLLQVPSSLAQIKPARKSHICHQRMKIEACVSQVLRLFNTLLWKQTCECRRHHTRLYGSILQLQDC